MKNNTRKRSVWFRSLLTLAVVTTATGVVALGPVDAAQAAPASSGSAEREITLDRWSYVWQRWDGTTYSSQAACRARGRAVKQHYRDVKDYSCRRPCGRWWLYTYRQQWV